MGALGYTEKYRCVTCNKTRFMHQFNQDDLIFDCENVECVDCKANPKLPANAKCMRCSDRYRNKHGHKFGICERCKQSEDYAHGYEVYSVAN